MRRTPNLKFLESFKFVPREKTHYWHFNGKHCVKSAFCGAYGVPFPDQSKSVWPHQANALTEFNRMRRSLPPVISAELDRLEKLLFDNKRRGLRAALIAVAKEYAKYLRKEKKQNKDKVTV